MTESDPESSEPSLAAKSGQMTSCPMVEQSVYAGVKVVPSKTATKTGSLFVDPSKPTSFVGDIMRDILR